MDLLSPKHLILILVIVLIVFGSRKLRDHPIGKMRAGRPLRLWLVAMMAIVALMVLAFTLRLGY